MYYAKFSAQKCAVSLLQKEKNRRKKVDKGLSCDKILGECLNSYIVKRGEVNGQGLFKSYGRDGKGKKC